jgi:Rieske Fe-S protein
VENKKQKSRRTFLRIAVGVCLGFLGWTWIRISNFQNHKEFRTEYRHGLDIPLGISYYGKYYLFRSKSSLRAFSTECTHAGCRIGMSHGNVLQCSCHGSLFDGATGNPVRGPAFKPLQELECKFDEVSNQWIVRRVV